MFFKPVFNIADAAISAGVINILLFQRSFFSGSEKKKDVEIETTATVANELADDQRIKDEVEQKKGEEDGL